MRLRIQPEYSAPARRIRNRARPARVRRLRAPGRRSRRARQGGAPPRGVASVSSRAHKASVDRPPARVRPHQHAEHRGLHPGRTALLSSCTHTSRGFAVLDHRKTSRNPQAPGASRRTASAVWSSANRVRVAARSEEFSGRRLPPVPASRSGSQGWGVSPHSSASSVPALM